MKQIHKSSRYSSLRIPLTCALTLLLVIGNIFCVFSKTPEVFADSVDDNSDITTYATTTINPTASLTIGGDATNKQVIASPGSTAYRSHTVTVDASDIESYALVLSGPTNLTSGTSTIVSGANNTTPDTNASNPMLDNTWGYSWGGDSNKETSTYKSLSPTGATLTGDRVSGFKVNFTRNLFFAAKFSEDADPGRYQANVTLSLAATPRAVATGFNGIYDMQDMTGEICAKANIGDTGNLEDIRDGNVYSIAKLSDGNCWMTRNLRLVDYTTTEDDSQTGGFTIPKSEAWNVCTNYDAPDVFYNGNPSYGAYYNWYAATAGTGPSGLASGNASGSICPKGWRLPTRVDYNTLIKDYPWEWATVGNDTGPVLGGAFFPPANLWSCSGKMIGYGGGRYWTSEASGANNAVNMYFVSASGNLATTGALRTDGRSVRCVAESMVEATAAESDIDFDE